MEEQLKPGEKVTLNGEEMTVISVKNSPDAVADAIANLREEIADRSFSGRHPELGKMTKCQVCGLRHRSSIVCKENVIVPTAQTRKGVYGAAAFAKKRLKPHNRIKKQIARGVR